MIYIKTYEWALLFGHPQSWGELSETGQVHAKSQGDGVSCAMHPESGTVCIHEDQLISI